MNRITTVIKTTILGFIGINLILICILFLDSIDKNTLEIPWEHIGLLNLYGITFSTIFGIMDRPKLEIKLLKAITISALVVFISSFFIDISKNLVTHSYIVLIGIPLTKAVVSIIDILLQKKRN